LLPNGVVFAAGYGRASRRLVGFRASIGDTIALVGLGILLFTHGRLDGSIGASYVGKGEYNKPGVTKVWLSFSQDWQNEGI